MPVAELGLSRNRHLRDSSDRAQRQRKLHVGDFCEWLREVQVHCYERLGSLRRALSGGARDYDHMQQMYDRSSALW